MKVIDLQPSSDGVWRPVKPWWHLSKVEIFALVITIFGGGYIADAVHALQAFLSGS